MEKWKNIVLGVLKPRAPFKKSIIHFIYFCPLEPQISDIKAAKKINYPAASGRGMKGE